MYVRPITFVDYVEISNVKSELSSNICLYDIDEDGDVELLVGQWDNTDGTCNSLSESEASIGSSSLKIIKYNKIHWEVNVNGIVTCVCAGKIINKLEPQVLVLCANSRCYCFTISSSATAISGKEIKQIHAQWIGVNARSAVIEDIDQDGQVEVIIGSSDRCVRMYRYIEHKTSNSNDSLVQETGLSGAFVELLRWELTGQIGNLSLHENIHIESDEYSRFQILASQPGGTIAILFWRNEGSANDNDVDNNNQKRIPLMKYRSLTEEGKDAARMNDMHAEVIGSVQSGPNKADGLCIAVCTLDGVVALLNEEKTLMQVHLGRTGLFGLCKLDITKDDAEEIVVCSWEGAAYVISHHQRGIACFQQQQQSIGDFQYCDDCVGGSSQAFTAGYYSVAPGNCQPVLIYSSPCQESLLVHYNLHLRRIPARSLLQELSPALRLKIRGSGIDVTDNAQLRRFLSRILYSWGPQKINSIDIKCSSNTKDDFYQLDPQEVHSPLVKARWVVGSTDSAADFS